MANALKFHTVVRGKKLTLADLDAFEGKHVEVIVMEDEGASSQTEAPNESITASGIVGLFADQAEALDEIVQQAYQDRSSSKWQRPTDEDLT